MPPSLDRIVTELAKFPGIGKKTARRLAFHLLDTPREEVEQLASALLSLKENVVECRICHHIAEGELCPICSDTRRDSTTVCVVERVLDVLIFERMGEYQGHYHVLGGVISPLDGISPDNLNIVDLIERLPEMKEMIIATHPSIEGDTTALYIAQQAEGLPVKITRLARGIPMGTNLEFTDEATLASAFTARVGL
ncbi:MAG: recombination mediator RecR [Candidatus Neomarinimicrobiota bacterium]